MIEPQPYPFVLKEAVPDSFCAYVNDLIQRNIDQFGGNKAGANRKYMKMDYVSPDGDQVLYAMKQKLAAHFELGEYVVPPNLKDFVGYITEGGSIHPHTDADLPGKRHVRINVLVQQPGGCVPLMENIPISVAVGDAWLNLASQVIHATTPVVGPGFRSAISFGYQIDPARGDAFYETHKDWMKQVRKLSA